MRFIRLTEVLKLTGLSRTTVYKYIYQGSFPRNIKIGPRAVVWIEGEIDLWIKAYKRNPCRNVEQTLDSISSQRLIHQVFN
ncbi:helix-turn-helix transcriptional regulator [Vibrio sp. RC27]